MLGGFAIAHYVSERAVVLWAVSSYFGKLGSDSEGDTDVGACTAQVAQ